MVCPNFNLLKVESCLHALIVEHTFQQFLCSLEIRQSSSLKSASLFQALQTVLAKQIAQRA